MHLEDHYPFEVKPLKYSYGALEPFIGEQNLYYHHQAHYRRYVEKLNNALANHPELHNMNIEELIFNIELLPEEIREDIWVNGGGVYNHQIYFETMTPSSLPLGENELSKAIIDKFNTLPEFMKEFKNEAFKLVGSGYVWLVSDLAGNLKIVITHNQDTTIIDNYCPLLGIDMWEHSYYLKYIYNKEAYIDAWFSVVDWPEVVKNYLECLQYIKDAK